MSKPITVSAPLTPGDLAKQLDIKATDVVVELMKNGVMATINDMIDFDTAAIVSAELGFEIALKVDSDDALEIDTNRRHMTVLNPGEGEPRPPVIVVMGHVDHGKTTLLDAIKNSDVAAGEAGGITQHISAYQIIHQDRLITFLDTPGHEAFSMLREHGARLTDVAIIVIAADDGIKPQTKEAIDFVRSSGVRMLVAVNKVDKPDADPNRIRQQLADINIIPEEWGGDTVVVDVSAKTKQNLDKLLDVTLLVADIEDLRARPGGDMEGTIIESRMLKGQGSVATVLVHHGELNVGDYIVAGDTYAKVRSLKNMNGEIIKQALPSTPVAISGWKNPPSLGAFTYEVNDEKTARVESLAAANKLASTSGITQADAMTAAMHAGQVSTLAMVIKADSDGSIQAVKQSIESLKHPEVRAEIASSGVGDITESDVTLAESAGAMIVGFNVVMSGRIKQLAIRGGVEVKLYSVIYELLDEVRDRLSAMLKPEIIEETLATLKVLGVFKTAQHEIICGGEVTKGKLVPDLLVRIKDGEEIGVLTGLKREQQEAKDLTKGDIGGLKITTAKKVKINLDEDRLEFFTRREEIRTL